MAKWRLAKSLEILREQINAVSPNRNKASDGTISDAAHRARVSDHNPNHLGIVTAMDITHDPTQGVDGKILSRWLSADTRTKYVIFAGEIWKARTRQWERYTGPNKHSHHVHVSVTPEGADDTHAWAGIGEAQTVRPTLKLGDRGSEVARLQVALGIEADSIFGFGTMRRVQEFQRAHGLQPDGVVGTRTWEALK